MMENMLAQMAPDLQDYVANQREFARAAPWNQPRQTAPQPQEDPAEQQRLNELLAEVGPPRRKSNELE
jgi:hypothetical protein